LGTPPEEPEIIRMTNSTVNT